MRYNIPITLIEFPFSKNEIGTKYAYFTGECFFTEGRKPRIVETTYTITAVTALGNDRYVLTIAEDTDTLDKNDLLINSVNSDKYAVIGVNDIHTLTVTSKNVPSGTTTVLADSTYQECEHILIDSSKTYYAQSVDVATIIDTVNKKKI